LVGIERGLNLVSDDPFENVTVKTMLPLINGQRDISEAPDRVIRAVTYLGIVDLARTLNRATWESATDDERSEAAQARRDWGLPPEGDVSVDDLLKIGHQEGLSAAILKRLKRELPPLLAAPDPDQCEAVRGGELPPLNGQNGYEPA
jgi:hypothetical protein